MAIAMPALSQPSSMRSWLRWWLPAIVAIRELILGIRIPNPRNLGQSAKSSIHGAYTVLALVCVGISCMLVHSTHASACGFSKMSVVWMAVAVINAAGFATLHQPWSDFKPFRSIALAIAALLLVATPTVLLASLYSRPQLFTDIVGGGVPAC